MPDCVILNLGSEQKGHKRVLRGGSWNNNGRNLRSANRNANTPDNRNDNIGLRLAGALQAVRWAIGGSANQLAILSHYRGQTIGRWRVSRWMQQYLAESLPPGRFTFRQIHGA